MLYSKNATIVTSDIKMLAHSCTDSQSNVLFQFYKTESPENIYSEEFEPRLKDSYVAELLKVPYMRTRDNITFNKGDKALCVKKVHDNLEFILVEVL